MEFNQIANFIPFYPALTDPEFSYNIARKKEFNEYALTSDYIQIPGLFRQQVIIQRFLSPATLYNELLIYHRVGAGKTATALAVGEAWKTQARETYACETKGGGDTHLKTPSQCPLIIVRSVDRFKPIFEQELKDRFPEYLSPAATFKRNYHMESYQTSWKNVKPADYSNRVIIIDEAHNLQPQPVQRQEEKDTEMYSKLLQKLSGGVNSKKILLTGTPIPDHASQIIPLMNLILPKPIPSDAYTSFKKFYFENNKFIPKSTLTDPQYDLTQQFKGRVSYFRSIIPSIMQDDQGTKNVEIIESKEETIVIGTIVPVVCDVMSNFQYTTANISFEESEKSNAFGEKARRAATMVFPESWSGKKDIQSEIGKMGGDLDVLQKYSATFYSILQDIRRYPDNLFFIYLDYVNGPGSQLNLGYVLEHFLKYAAWGTGSPQKKKTYAILGLQRKLTSGQSRLKKLQKGRIHPTRTDAKERTETATEAEARTRVILDVFNNKNNIKGKKIHVLIGGKKSGEGITIKNVTRVHLLPYWNYKEGQQAIGRTIRPVSHDALIQNHILQTLLTTLNLDGEEWTQPVDAQGKTFYVVNAQTRIEVVFDNLLGLTRKFTLTFSPPHQAGQMQRVNESSYFNVKGREGTNIFVEWTDTIKVKVFHHVAVGPPAPASNLYRTTQAVHVFNRATQKYYPTAQVLEFLKTISFDCPLTYPKNIAGDANYYCRDFPEKEIDKEKTVWNYSIQPSQIQYDTYDFFYTNREEIINKIAPLFVENSIMSFPEMLEQLKERPNPLLGALQSMISRNYSLKNRFGFQCCLREDRNMYFLVDRRDAFRGDQKYEHAIYSALPFVTYQTSLQTLNDFQLLTPTDSANNIQNFCKNPTAETFQKLSFRTRTRLLEEFYQKFNMDMDMDSSSFIGALLTKNIYKMKTGVVVHIMFSKFHTAVGSRYKTKVKYTGEMRVLGADGWRDAFPAEEKKYIDSINKMESGE